LETADIVESSLTTHHAHWEKLRRDLQAHPELRFEEHRAADVVARELEALGYEVSRGLGGTGVVASLPGANPAWGIVLRADLDALPIHEANDFTHASCAHGVMHACGRAYGDAAWRRTCSESIAAVARQRALRLSARRRRRRGRAKDDR
jgi:hippurate hydrolase